MYSIGQKVKCINGNWGQATGSAFQKVHCPNLPVVGSTYTIRSCEQVIALLGEGPKWFVLLVEIRNPVIAGTLCGEPVFYGSHFVPLIEGKEANLDWAYEILKNPEKVVKRTKEVVGRLRKEKRHERVKNSQHQAKFS